MDANTILAFAVVLVGPLPHLKIKRIYGKNGGIV